MTKMTNLPHATFCHQRMNPDIVYDELTSYFLLMYEE